MPFFVRQARQKGNGWIVSMGLVLGFLVKITHIVPALGVTLLELYHTRFASLIAPLDHAPESRLVKGRDSWGSGCDGSDSTLACHFGRHHSIQRVSIERSWPRVWYLGGSISETLAAWIEKRILRFVGFHYLEAMFPDVDESDSCKSGSKEYTYFLVGETIVLGRSRSVEAQTAR